MGLGGDSWNYKTSIRHHQQTNTQRFTGRMPFLLPNPNSVRELRGKTWWLSVSCIMNRFLSFIVMWICVKIPFICSVDSTISCLKENLYCRCFNPVHKRTGTECVTHYVQCLANIVIFYSFSVKPWSDCSLSTVLGLLITERICNKTAKNFLSLLMGVLTLPCEIQHMSVHYQNVVILKLTLQSSAS